MANTYVDYTGDGNQTSFAYTFAVLSGRQQDHIIVGVDDSTTTGGKFEVVDPADYTIDTSAGTITFDTAPELGARIRIRRDSDASTLLVDFKNGTVLPERDLDLAYLHNLFLNEEIEEGSGKNTLVKNADGNYDGDSVKLVNLADPENAQDAVTKGYADGRYVDEAGDTMTGNLDMGSNEVTSSAVPSGNNSLTNKSYVDGEVSTEASARVAGDALQVTKAGDSMSGDLTMTSPAKVVQAAAPTTANDLTNKTYVDGVVATEASNRASGDATLTNSKVSKSGDTMTGALTLPAADPSSDNHATRKRYVDQRIAVAVSSGTPGGPIETDNIDDGAITTAKIDDGAVTTAKIEDDAVTAAKLDHTTVTAGSYTNTDITVDENGRITAASNGSSGAGATNLSNTPAASSVEITSSTGNNTTVAGASTSLAGVMTSADKQKLNGIATGATANSSDATLLNRANHTGTQTAATISDFDTEVANNTAVAANTAKVSNATHTGDVTGSTVLTIANGAVTPAKTDFDKLDINAPTSSDGDGSGHAAVEMFGVSGAYIDLKNNSTEDYDARIVSGTVTNSILEVHGKLGTKINTGSGNATAIFADSTNKVRIGDATTPVYDLDVTGDINITGDFRKNGNIVGGVSKWDSGWFNDTTGLINNGSYTFSHTLGTAAAQVQVWMATDSSGSDIKMCMHEAVDGDGSFNINYNAWITNITSSNITVQLGSQSVYYNNSGIRVPAFWTNSTTYTHIKVIAIG